MIGYKEIVINGKEYTYKFSMRSFDLFQKATKTKKTPKGMKIDEFFQRMVDDNLDMDMIVLMFHCALQSGSQRKKEKLKFTANDLFDFLDDDPSIYAKMLMSMVGADLPDEDKEVSDDETIDGEVDKKK